VLEKSTSQTSHIVFDRAGFVLRVKRGTCNESRRIVALVRRVDGIYTIVEEFFETIIKIFLGGVIMRSRWHFVDDRYAMLKFVRTKGSILHYSNATTAGGRNERTSDEFFTHFSERRWEQVHILCLTQESNINSSSCIMGRRHENEGGCWW
jgi:hypothetical protein